MRVALIAVSLLVCSGCGTLANLDSKASNPFLGMHDVPDYSPTCVYGGVKRDIAWGWPFLLDVPLSAVGDTVTLPVVFADPD